MAQFAAIAAVVASLTVVTILFGELTPKVFAIRNKERVCLKLSPPMEWFSYSVWPAVWFLESTVNAITRLGERLWKTKTGEEAQAEATLQEIRGRRPGSHVTLDRSSGRGNHRRAISPRPLRRCGGSCSRPTTSSMLSVHQTLAEALIAAHQDMHTRFPVTETPGDPQSIVGYVNFKDIVAVLRLSPRDPRCADISHRLRSFDADMSVADSWSGSCASTTTLPWCGKRATGSSA